MLGDCWHRFYVRMLEVRAVDAIWSGRRSTATARAAGDVGEPIKLTQKLPKGEAYLETEAPKGQMGFMIVSDGTADSLARAGAQQLLLQPVGHCRSCAAAA